MADGAKNSDSKAADILDKVAWPLVILIVFFTLVASTDRIAKFFGSIAEFYKDFDVSVSERASA